MKTDKKKLGKPNLQTREKKVIIILPINKLSLPSNTTKQTLQNFFSIRIKYLTILHLTYQHLTNQTITITKV